MVNAFLKTLVAGSALLNPLLADPVTTTHYLPFPEDTADGLFINRLYDSSVTGESQASFLPGSGISGNYKLGENDSYFSKDRAIGLNRVKVSNAFSSVSQGADKTIANYEIRMTFGGYDDVTKNYFPEFYTHYSDGSGLDAPYFLWASFNATAGYVGDIGGVHQYRIQTSVSYGVALPAYTSAVLYNYLNLWVSSGCLANGQVPGGDSCYLNKGLFSGSLCANMTNPNGNVYVETKGSYSTMSTWSATQINEHANEYIYFGIGGYDAHGNGVNRAPLIAPLSYSAWKTLPAPSLADDIRQQGYDQGYKEGYDLGETNGRNDGYNQGYKDGYNAGANTTGQNANAVKWVNSIFDGMTDLLSVNIFPGVSLAFFVFFPLALGVICLLIKFLA